MQRSTGPDGAALAKIVGVQDVFSPGFLAVLLGGIVAIVAFVPFVAISYRRRGGLTFGRTSLWFAVVIYFWAIWTYTLLPIPDSEDYRCAGKNLHPFQFFEDIFAAVAVSGNYITDPVVLQVALNVLLFMPLGFFLRVLGGRGILIAGFVGLSVSAIIETTQLTGVWGIFPCAYRVFDVDDLITNTAGALLGSFLGFVVPKKYRGPQKSSEEEFPRPVTRFRRLLGIVCDILGLSLLGSGFVVGLQATIIFLLGQPALPDATVSFVGTVFSVLVWLVVILGTGCSIGDLATRVHYTDGVLPRWLARLLRFLTGSATYMLGISLDEPWPYVSLLLAVATLVFLFVWKDGRGLTGWIGRRHLVDSRESVVLSTVLSTSRRGYNGDN